MQLLDVILNNHWQPGLGDPTFIGWFTVAAYLITSLLCLVCALPTSFLVSPDRVSYSRWLWWFFALFLLVLGINKQLDLQSWLTVVGKELAQSQGWYQQRRTVQIKFIAGIVVASFILLTVIGRAIHAERQKYGLAFLGLMFLSCFIVMRASSFNHIDRMLPWQGVEFGMHWLLELGGIACIAIAALSNILAGVTWEKK